jgi:hypothetical protein
MVEARSRIVAATKEAGLPISSGVPAPPDVLKQQVEEGYTVLLCTADAGVLVEGLGTSLKESRAATSG